MKTLAIIGSRTFDNYDYLCEVAVQFYLRENYDTIVSGGAKGADNLGKRYAEYWGMKYIEFLPNWDLYGKSAGFKRNIEIITKADHIWAFWDGLSNGTRHSLNIAKQLKKISFVFYF